MFYPGIVSVTYRPLTPKQLIDIAADASLCCIEWGGDVHVPHGDLDTAKAVGLMTRKAGLSVISYGTYYRAGTCGEDFPAVFSAMLDTADALGAPNLRLWAGTKHAEDVTSDERRSITNELSLCAAMAAERGKTISFEYHGGTLTNTAVSAKQLIEDLGAANASLYWQPNPHLSHEDNCAALALVLPYVSHVHVFAWEPGKRLPLQSHIARWQDYLSMLKTTGRDHGLLLEFVPQDDPAVLSAEAMTLCSML